MKNETIHCNTDKNIYLSLGKCSKFFQKDEFSLSISEHRPFELRTKSESIYLSREKLVQLRKNIDVVLDSILQEDKLISIRNSINELLSTTAETL